MEFDTDWMTLGKHRVRLLCARGFPTEKTRYVAEVSRLAIEHNLSAAARLLQVAAVGESSYTISIGTTFPKDKDAALPLEVALATVFGLKPDRISMEITVVSQADVDLHFGVYERMLAEKLGIIAPIH